MNRMRKNERRERLVTTLRQRRVDLGMTQAALGEIIGNNSQAYVSRLECGRSTCCVESLLRWADALGLAVTIEPKP